MEYIYIYRGVRRAMAKISVKLLAIVKVRLRVITVLFYVCACGLPLRVLLFVLTCVTRFGILVFALCTKTP